MPLALDVTEQTQVDAVAEAARDVTPLVNNAGVLDGRGLMEAPNFSFFEGEMAVNVFGLAQWVPFGTYTATKAAAMSLTETHRFELRDKGVDVSGIFAGFIDTEMAGFVDGDKSSPDEVARNAMAGIEAGDRDIDADAGVMAPPSLVSPDLGSLLYFILLSIK